MNGRSRDPAGLEAGQRVIYRRHGSTVMYAGRIHSIDVQRAFPVRVVRDDDVFEEDPIHALCDELLPFPPVSVEAVEDFLTW